MQRLLLAMMFGLGFGLAVSEAGAQTISDRLKDPSRKPGTPVVIGTLGEPRPLSVEELTKRSDLILEGRVSWLKSYINVEDTAVITDYTIVPIRVLAGTVPGATRQPGVATPLRLSVYGGEVIRDGVTIRAESHDLESLKSSGFYLFFLKKFGKEPGVYTIYNAGVFELSDNIVRPLARQEDLYKDFSKPYSEVVTRIMAAARAR